MFPRAEPGLLREEQAPGDFPGGPVIRSPLTNTGGMDSIPCLGRSHMPQRNEARETQLLSPHATTTEACEPRAYAWQQEKPPQEACAPK